MVTWVCFLKVYGALRMSVKIFLMWNSTMIIDGGEDVILATSLLEASNLIVLKVCHCPFLAFSKAHIAYNVFIYDVSAFSISEIICHTF